MADEDKTLLVVEPPGSGPGWGLLACPTRRRVIGATLAMVLTRMARAATPLPVMLAREWPADGDPAGYLVSEKFDGVRALWDGHQLRFRSGARIAAPAWFTERLPRQPLDGELWAGRGRFETLVSTVRAATPDDAAWRAVSYQVFELPAGEGTYAERARQLRQLVEQADFAALVAVDQQPVASRAELQRRLDDVVALGGEGLVLHHADAAVATGRKAGLWKHKPLHDAEGTVVAYLPGRGRLAGHVGALKVRTDAGVEFAIGTGLDDAARQAPPQLGQRITYTHRGWTRNGVPRFASYLRVSPGI